MTSNKELTSLGRSFHKRLLSGTDPCVSAELCELFLPLLNRALSRRFHRLPDPHLTETFAIDALLKYLASPEKFNPKKGSLIAYLYMDAYGDLLNFLEKQKKFVEHHDSYSEYEVKALTEDQSLDRTLIDQSLSIAERVIAETLDPTDRELIELMLEGERRTERYADVLGIFDLPKDQRASEVKRRKDRLKIKVKRQLEKLYGSRIQSILRHARNRKPSE